MHIQQNFRFFGAQQANLVYRYENMKENLCKTKAAIWYNKTCRHKQLTPNYISIKINGDKPQKDNSASCWFILYEYITMYGQQNLNK
jgi:hypothetical protein